MATAGTSSSSNIAKSQKLSVIPNSTVYGRKWLQLRGGETMIELNQIEFFLSINLQRRNQLLQPNNIDVFLVGHLHQYTLPS